MPAKDFGIKYTCFKCSTKFYDMKKPDPICPKCGADQREASTTRASESRRSRLAAAPKIIEPVEPAEPAEAEEGELEVEEEEVVADED
ncbi:MAG: FYDLN acid domain-containing protein [Myxococcaceae bacterium]|nr:FYDLN acid domain-containing protein [Myxococcaceae bacterium]